jgi:hypothetical protein
VQLFGATMHEMSADIAHDEAIANQIGSLLDRLVDDWVSQRWRTTSNILGSPMRCWSGRQFGLRAWSKPMAGPVMELSGMRMRSSVTGCAKSYLGKKGRTATR